MKLFTLAALCAASLVTAAVAETLIDSSEQESSRSATTRTWENTYEVPVLDADGNPTEETEEVRRSFIEVADGLHYDARSWEEIAEGGAPNWQPTVTAWANTSDLLQPFAVMAGPLQVRLSDDLTSPYLVSISGDAETLHMGVAGIAMQNALTGEIVLLEEPTRVQPTVDENRVLFAGAFSVGDVEYVYERGGFKQNLILRSLVGLPTPASLGWEDEETLVGLASTMNLADCQNPLALGSTPIESELSQGTAFRATAADRLTLLNAAGETVLRFAPGDAWDGAGVIENTAPVHETACRVEGQNLLIDAVSHTWLCEAELPVTVDYKTVSGSQTPKNILWERGVTYYVSSTYTVPSGMTLVAEPGAVIKINGALNPGIAVASGGTFRILGVAFDPVVVTKADDDNVGEVITGETAGTYTTGVKYQSGSNGQTRWARLGNGTTGILFEGTIGNLWDFDQSIDEGGIEHSVFAGFTTPIKLSDPDGTLHVFNCLLAHPSSDSGTGVDATLENGELTLAVVNSTFHHHTTGISLDTTGGDVQANVYLYNNLFSNASTSGTTGMYASSLVDLEGVISDNSFESVGTQVNVSGPSNVNPQTIVGNPFFGVSTYGTHFTATYIGKTIVTDPSDGLGSSGSFSPLDDMVSQLAEMTVVSPIEIDSDQIDGIDASADIPGTGDTNDLLTNWKPRTSGAIDIRDASPPTRGFHYPRVDYVIDSGSLSLTRDLTIQAGTRVAWEPTETAGGGLVNVFKSGSDLGKIIIDGDPTNMVEFFSANASGDAVNDSEAGDYYGIKIATSGSASSRLEHLRVRHAYRALFLEVDRLLRGKDEFPLESCQFIDCGTGVYFSSPQGGDILNSLFLRCGDGVFVEFGSPGPDLTFAGNTFSACTDQAIDITDDDSGAPFSIVLENNLFVGNQGDALRFGYMGQTHSEDFHAVDRNNAWYLNKSDLTDNSNYDFVTTDDKINPDASNRGHQTDNPLLVNVSRAANSDPRWETRPFDDGHFLAQRTGDASRLPLIVPAGVDLANTNGITVSGGLSPVDSDATIYVGLADISALPPSDYYYTSSSRLGKLASSTYTDDSQVGDGERRLWVIIDNQGWENGWPSGAGTITLNFADSASDESRGSLDIHIPSLALLYEEVQPHWGGWVALDGSVYYGHSGNSTVGMFLNPPFDQDSGYSLAVDQGALARSAYDAGGTASPLINLGSLDWLNSGTTNTNLTSSDNGTGPIDFVLNLLVASSSTPITVGEIDMGYMDIGYHYEGELRHPTQSVDRVPVPTSKGVSIGSDCQIQGAGPDWSAIDDATGAFLTFVDIQIDSNREIDVVSGPFVSNIASVEFGQDATIAVFPTKLFSTETGGTEDPDAIAIGIVPFRNWDGATSVPASPGYVDVISSATIGRTNPLYLPYELPVSPPPGSGEVRFSHVIGCSSVAACTTPARGEGTSAGAMYVAAVVNRATSPEEVDEFAYDQLFVWRIELTGYEFPDNFEDFELCGQNQIYDDLTIEGHPDGYGVLIASSDIPEFTDEERILIHDVSLSADNASPDGGVYVSWIEEYPDATGGHAGPRLVSQYVAAASATGEFRSSVQRTKLGRWWNGNGLAAPTNVASTASAILERDFVVDGKAGLSPSHRTIAFRNRALVPEEPFEEEVTVLNSTEGDFDFNEPDGPSGQPRLVHFDFEGAVEFVTDVGPRAALVEVNPTTRVPVDVPSVIDEPEALAWLIDESSDFIGSTMLTNRPEEMFASLTVNHAVNGSQSTVETSAHAAFNLSAEFSSGEDGYDHFTQDLKQDAQARDDWQEPARGGSVAQPTATPTEDNLDYPDITWRFSGVPREISAQQVGTVEKVSTDREVLLDDGVEALSSSLFPHVATNGANLIDNFATFVTTSGGSQEINLVHIDP